MEVPVYQIDAFASRVFAGNPAAVCPLEAWLPDATMQAVAAENNLSETAFFVREGDDHRIRWFTPAIEVDLCGHATLASGFLILTRLEPRRAAVTFQSKSGPLRVARDGARFTLDFPSLPPASCETPAGMVEALGVAPSEMATAAGRYFAVLADEAAVRAVAPDMARVAEVAPQGLTVTAPGDTHDFVSRMFAPSKGIPEDPVTGSTHTSLIPFWAARLNRNELRAAQLSLRGGELHCRLRGDRVDIAGEAALYMEGRIFVPGAGG